MLPLLLSCALLSGADPGPGVAPGELVLLLEIGVGEREIALYADRVGGFQSLDGETFARVEELGASSSFLGRLPRVNPDFGTLSEIASASEVYEDTELGLGFVYPTGWTVSPILADDGAVVLRIAPRSGSEPRVFVTSSLFLFVVEESALVAEAAGPIRGRLAHCLQRRLRKAGLRPSVGPAGAVLLLGEERETLTLEAAVDGAAPGVLEVAFEVDAKGRALGVGFTAPAADRERAKRAFERLARSVVLR